MTGMQIHCFNPVYMLHTAIGFQEYKYFQVYLYLHRFFFGPLHMDVSMLADQQELIYISFARTLDVV